MLPHREVVGITVTLATNVVEAGNSFGFPNKITHHIVRS